MANSDINSVVIVGRLTRDAELRYLNSGTAVASISIAVNRSKKDGDQWISEANFFDVSYFGKGAEIAFICRNINIKSSPLPEEQCPQVVDFF